MPTLIPTPKIWMNGELVDWDKAQVHVLTHTLHYGNGVFEGIRAYETDRGPAVFRLREHIERLAVSEEPVYGISTGFGALAQRHIPMADRVQLQKSLIRSHAAGEGSAAKRSTRSYVGGRPSST